MEDLLRTTYQSVMDGTSKPQRFIQLVEEIDWKTRTPDSLAETIEMALYLDLINLARRLLATAAEHGYMNEDIERLAEVLIPSGNVTTSPTQNPKIAESMRWLRKHAEAYAGLWVALDGGVLLGSAETHTDLITKVGKRKDIMVTRIRW